jgi:outer membrane lipoprotein-sorting protein
MKIFITAKVKLAALAVACLVCPRFGLAAENSAPQKPFQDEPAARQLYSGMVEAIRQAKSLSWVGDYRWEARGSELGHATYKIWLKKPNYARVEAVSARDAKAGGILVGDGDYFWIYWPNGKPRYGWENQGKYAEEYDKYGRLFYMKQRTPLGRHSIGHEVDKLGAGMSMTILDPSTFHGYTDSLQAYLDGVQNLGTEKVGEEEGDVIEVSFMKHQRSWNLWLSRKDHLPRKLKQVVRVSYDILIHEVWSNLAINPDIPAEKFCWSPPADWKEWRMPSIEEGLLKPGTEAPDFELTSIAGDPVKLSNFRGKIVWLNKWRCG